jgi:hypothetical protein
MKTIKLILTFFIISNLISCEKNNKKLELTILNDTIKCVKNLDYFKLYNNNSIYDKLYDSLSTNIIKYKLFNNSNNKYFIVFDDNFFNNYEEMYYDVYDTCKNTSINYVNFSMYSDYIVKGNHSRESPDNDYINSKNFEFDYYYRDSINFLKHKKCYNTKNSSLSRDINYVSTNSFVIYPKETKYFSTIINLPLRDYRFNPLTWDTHLIKNKTYQAGIILYNDAKRTRQYLNPDLKKEIKENGYTIFSGVIKSNKVPVKMISLPE